MAGFKLNRADFSFKIQEKENWCELKTTARLINCDLFVLPSGITCEHCGKKSAGSGPCKYKIHLPHMWELHPQEMAIALDVIFEEIGRLGFSITGFGSRKPNFLEIEMVR